MKNLLIILALFTYSTFSVAQDSDPSLRETKKEKKTSKEDLSKFELQLGPGPFLLPSVSANVYLKENMILRLSSPSISFGSISRAISGEQYGARTFLEFRKYFNEKYYISHGPEVGFFSTRETDISGETYRINQGRVGYNLGAGFRYKERVTAGTYINPYFSFGENGTSFNHGRLFAGTLSNIYVAYRF